MDWTRTASTITLASENEGKDPALAALGARLIAVLPGAISHGWVRRSDSFDYDVTFGTVEQAKDAIAWLDACGNYFG